MRRLLLLLLLLMVAAPVNAQNSSRVYILVVDDFGQNFAALSSRLRNVTSVRDRLRTEVQRLPRANPRASGTPQLQQQQGQGRVQTTPVALQLRQDLRTQARQAVTESIQGNIDQQNCAVVPEGQGFFATGGASFFATGGAGFFATGGAGASAQRPHGVRVTAQLEELRQRYASNLNIEIVPVDTQGFTTTVITQRITETIAQLASANPGASFVVNMSFAVVPCDALATLAIYEALMQEADSQLAGDLAALQAVFNTLIATGVYGSSPKSGDNLLGYIDQRCDTSGNCTEGSSRVIAVAAAGNSAATFPFFPAAWGGVISVSASDDEADFVAAGTRARYSNAGAVLMPGVWRREVGTSFAAPRYSFAMALMLLGVTPTGCSATPSPLLPDDWLISSPASPNQKLC